MAMVARGGVAEQRGREAAVSDFNERRDRRYVWTV